MYFRSLVDASTKDALIGAGFAYEEYMSYGELKIEVVVPDEEWNHDAYKVGNMTLRGVHLVKRQKRFEGHIEASKGYDSRDGWEYVGDGQVQCSTCGKWYDGHGMTGDETRQHDRNCVPVYYWEMRA